jgi:tripartite ATP-independent transporter DctM subunit
MTAALAGFALLIAISLAGIPIAVAMLGIGFAGFGLIQGWPAALFMVSQIAYETVQNYGLSVLPMFVLMGAFINHSRLSGELYDAANAFLGHRRGGLAMATVVACGGFAAVSGSSVATAATMGKVSVPSMLARGYAPTLATGSVAAGGTLGILIPPSVVLVIYGILTNSDIGKLFAAGILPGLVGILFYVGAVQWSVWRDPQAGPPGPRIPWAARWRALGRVWAVALLFAVVIGGMYVGAFTPTEASGIGAFGAFVIALARRLLGPRTLFTVLVEAARTSAVMFFILIGGIVFSNFVNLAGLTGAMQAFVQSLDVPPVAVIFAIIAIYFVLGCVLESISMILLTVPVFFPVVSALGFDPIWFGIIVVVVTEISLITPPVGLNVFVISNLFRDVGTGQVFRGVAPFVVADLLRISLLVLVPGIVLFLPNLM